VLNEKNNEIKNNQKSIGPEELERVTPLGDITPTVFIKSIKIGIGKGKDRQNGTDNQAKNDQINSFLIQNMMKKENHDDRQVDIKKMNASLDGEQDAFICNEMMGNKGRG
jgi:hypothetical protein